MNQRNLMFVLVVAVVAGFVGDSAAESRSIRQISNGDLQLLGQVVGTARADADSVYLLGGPGRHDGRFEDATGQPNWQGWTHEDATATACMWQVSEF